MNQSVKSLNAKRAGLVIALFFLIVILIRAYEEDKQFQVDSEDLAVGPIYAVTEGVELDTECYGLGRLYFENYPDDYVYYNVIANGASFADSYEYVPYRSQIGLQGMIYQLVAKGLSGILSFQLIYQGFRLACLMLFVAIVFLIVIQLKKRYGMQFALVFGGVTLLSPWTQNFACNLYWVEFTWFIPLLLGLLILNVPEKKIIWYVLFYLSVLVKSMCGYEYLSTILMSGVLFLLVEWFLHQERRKNIFKQVVVIAIISVLAFFTAYLIHAYIYGGGNIGNGLKMLQLDLVGRRTYGDAQYYDAGYADSLNASILSVLNKYIGFGDVHSVPMFVLFIATIAVLIYRKYKMHDQSKKDVCMFIISLLSTFSWLILAKGHSYMHTHMNFVLFYMGWAQISFYIIIKTVIEHSGVELIRKNGTD